MPTSTANSSRRFSNSTENSTDDEDEKIIEGAIRNESRREKVAEDVPDQVCREGPRLALRDGLAAPTSTSGFYPRDSKKIRPMYCM